MSTNNTNAYSVEATPQQAPIEIQLCTMAERLDILAKSLANLEDRLTLVRNRSIGVNAVNPKDTDKAASPMKDRLSNLNDKIDSMIYGVNSVIAELEI